MLNDIKLKDINEEGLDIDNDLIPDQEVSLEQLNEYLKDYSYMTEFTNRIKTNNAISQIDILSLESYKYKYKPLEELFNKYPVYHYTKEPSKHLKDVSTEMVITVPIMLLYKITSSIVIFIWNRLVDIFKFFTKTANNVHKIHHRYKSYDLLRDYLLESNLLLAGNEQYTKARHRMYLEMMSAKQESNYLIHQQEYDTLIYNLGSTILLDLTNSVKVTRTIIEQITYAVSDRDPSRALAKVLKDTKERIASLPKYGQLVESLSNIYIMRNTTLPDYTEGEANQVTTDKLSRMVTQLEILNPDQLRSKITMSDSELIFKREPEVFGTISTVWLDSYKNQIPLLVKELKVTQNKNKMLERLVSTTGNIEPDILEETRSLLVYINNRVVATISLYETLPTLLDIRTKAMAYLLKSMLDLAKVANREIQANSTELSIDEKHRMDKLAAKILSIIS